jgi:hypothetical protein
MATCSSTSRFPDGGIDTENPVDRNAAGSYTSGGMTATTHSLGEPKPVPHVVFWR